MAERPPIETFGENVGVLTSTVFGLEVTVGVAWAIPLDIGGEFAGSVASVMNTFGNLGSAVSPVLLAYFVGLYGWNMPFLVCSVLCVVGAILCLGLDANSKIG